MNIRTQIKNKLLSQNYLLTRYSYHFWWYINSIDKYPLVIFQMGKVGSTSIRDSLEALNLGTPIHQVHTLSQQGIEKMEQNYYGKTPTHLRHSLLPETKHIFAGLYLRTQLQKGSLKKRWKVITLVRDPIARNVSEFFYSVDTTKTDPHLPDFYEQYQSKLINTSTLVNRFLERFHESSWDYQLPLNWFDNEFKSVFEIDVFSSSFPKAKGYQIIKGDIADVLILKLEGLRQIVEPAFNEFLDLNNFGLITTNTAKEKKYYPAYKDFINQSELPLAYVDKIYTTKYVQHFYSADEINAFRRKWCGQKSQG